MAQTRTITRKKLIALTALDMMSRVAHVLVRPRQRLDGSPQKILVVEPWGIGDVVLSTPLLHQLRIQFPSARISLLAKDYAADLLANSDLVDEFIAFDFPWTAFSGKFRLSRYDFRALFNLIRTLRRADFDLSIDARRDIRTNLVVYLGRVRRRIGYDFGGGAHLLTDVVPSGDQNAHKVSDWLALLGPLGLEAASDSVPELVLTDEEKRKAREGLAALGVGQSDIVVGIHPGASHRVREWSPAKFAEVIDSLHERGVHAVMFAPTGATLPEIRTRRHVPVIQTDIRELMSYLSQCDLLVCSDSGPMHIAAALGVPVTAIFGPQRSEWYGPRGAAHRVVRVEEMSCRPCFDACIFSSPHCMDEVMSGDVLDAVQSQLEQLPAGRGMMKFMTAAPRFAER